MNNYYAPILESTDIPFVSPTSGEALVIKFINPSVNSAITDLITLNIVIKNVTSNAEIVNLKNQSWEALSNFTDRYQVSVSDVSFVENVLYSFSLAFMQGDEIVSTYSNVQIRKCIQPPELSCKIAQTDYEVQLFGEAIMKSQEIEDKFIFEWKKNNASEWNYSSELIHKTGNDKYVILDPLEKDAVYKVRYGVISINGYTAYKEISFIASGTTTPGTNDAFRVEPNNVMGYNKITIKSPTAGNLQNIVIGRKNKLNPQENWIPFLTLEKSTSTPYVFKDYTVDVGTLYDYRLFTWNGSSLTSKYQRNNCVLYFEDAYLQDKDSILKLDCNFKMTSFKRNVQRAKIDTIGSQYPLMVNNGNTNYAEIALTGLITFNSDNEIFQFFKQDEEKNLCYNNQIVIPKDMYLSIGRDGETLDQNIFNTIDTNTNRYIENIFRQKVYEFLNNGEYKLLRTPTDGNYIVVLNNVSLSPYDKTNHLIWTFSATAYEMAEFNTTNLKTYGLIDYTPWTGMEE